MADSPIIKRRDAQVHEHLNGDHRGGSYQVLSDMGPGHLGMNLTRVPPGRTCVPFHRHLREDEIFYVLEGTGVLRFGDDLFPIEAGDTISCPAGGAAHQILNTGAVDLVYLAIGPNDPHEVCEYPDTGKVMVRGLKTVGILTRTDYDHGEPEVPVIKGLVQEAG